jgi:hypothetical protein
MNPSMTWWQKFKFYFGICPQCGGKVKRCGYWKKAECNKCKTLFDVEGL